MSDRKKAIETLKQLRLDYEEFYEEHNNEVTQAYDMAIASLVTDEAYQLMEEQPKADKPTVIDWNNCHTPEQLKGISTTKNDLGVELIDRVELLKAMDTWDKVALGYDGFERWTEDCEKVPYVHYEDMVNCVKDMSSVTLQEPIKGNCKDCKYFEWDSVAEINGLLLIVAHETCSKWGNGCKTNENGYCFLFESKSEVEE